MSTPKSAWVQPNVYALTLRTVDVEVVFHLR